MDARNITPEGLERFLAFSPEQLLDNTESLSVTVGMYDLYFIGNWNFHEDYEYHDNRSETEEDYFDWMRETNVTLEFMSTGSFYKVGDDFNGQATGDDLATLQDIQNLIREGYTVYFNHWTLN